MLDFGALANHNRQTHAGAFFSSLLFVVPRAQGTGLRLIIDMRDINSHLRTEPLSLASPMLQYNRDLFRKGNGVLVIDFTSSLQHIQIHPEHQRFFGITWGGHRFVMTVAPSGCPTVPEMFQIVAGITRDVAFRIGLSPDLTTPEASCSFAPSQHSTPPSAGPFRPNRIFLPQTRITRSSFPRSIPSHDGHELSYMFQSKVRRYHASLDALRTRPTWTAHDVAIILGQITHLSLVWRDLSAIVSRPLYDFVATHSHSWFNRPFPPSDSSRQSPLP
jgi:hypothetical protein